MTIRTISSNRTRRCTTLAATAAVAVALLLTGCDEHPNAPPRNVTPNDTLQVVDFALPDVNPNSATAGRSLGPRLYLQQVSAWYFGHST